MAQWLAALLRTWLRRLAGYPLPRYCAWCGAQLPADAPEGQLYCSKTHKVKARRSRNGRPGRDAARQEREQQEVTAAWTLHGTWEAHAASCSSKIRYESFGDALGALRMLREGRDDAADAGVYQCLACEGWHITSHGKKRSRE